MSTEGDLHTDQNEDVYVKDYQKLMDNASLQGNKVSVDPQPTGPVENGTAVRKQLSMFKYVSKINENKEKQTSNVEKVKAQYFTPCNSSTQLNGKLPEEIDLSNKQCAQGSDLGPDQENCKILVDLLSENIGKDTSNQTKDVDDSQVRIPFENHLTQLAKKRKRNSSSDLVNNSTKSLPNINLKNDECATPKRDGTALVNDISKEGDITGLSPEKTEKFEEDHEKNGPTLNDSDNNGRPKLGSDREQHHLKVSDNVRLLSKNLGRITIQNSVDSPPVNSITTGNEEGSSTPENNVNTKTGMTITIDQGNKHVSFQTDVDVSDDFHLPTSAFVLFRQARNAKLSKVKYEEKVDHLIRLISQDKAPLWALNCGTWPDNFLSENDKQAFVGLHKMHARERLELMINILSKKIETEESEYHAYYSTFATYCAQHGLTEEAQVADGIIAKLVASERKRSQSVYLEKEEKLLTPNSERVWSALTAGAPSQRRGRNRSTSRSRSRSPRPRSRGPNETDTRGRGRGGFRGSYRGNNSRGFPRGGSRGRGFRGRGAPRGNLRPQYTEYDGKSHGGLEVRNLRDHEAAMVLALRESLRSNEQSM